MGSTFLELTGDREAIFLFRVDWEASHGSLSQEPDPKFAQKVNFDKFIIGRAQNSKTISVKRLQIVSVATSEDRGISDAHRHLSSREFVELLSR